MVEIEIQMEWKKKKEIRGKRGEDRRKKRMEKGKTN